MRFKTTLGVIFILLVYLFSIESEEPQEKSLIILNMKNEAVLPKNFRTVKDTFQTEEPAVFPTREGLDDLNMSGSGQFSEESLKGIIHHLGRPCQLYMIDLRQECHGFINGTAISWYAPKDWGNIHKTLPEIEELEERSLADLLKQHRIVVHRVVKKDPNGEKLPEADPIQVSAHDAVNEKKLAARYQLQYLRLPVTDHIRPTDEIVDKFIAFVNTRPKNCWIHFHCAAGVGRTTTFMAMYDMMINAKKVSFEDIIKRQWLIGGLNLKKISNKYPWKYPYALARFNFLKEFYNYCQLNQDNFQQDWTTYVSKIKDKQP